MSNIKKLKWYLKKILSWLFLPKIIQTTKVNFLINKKELFKGTICSHKKTMDNVKKIKITDKLWLVLIKKTHFALTDLAMQKSAAS